MSYLSLTYKERIIIETLLIQGLNYAAIGKYLHRNKSTISNEVSRVVTASSAGVYIADIAQQVSDSLKSKRGAKSKVTPTLKTRIEYWIKDMQYSPEVASHKTGASKSTIYKIGSIIIC